LKQNYYESNKAELIKQGHGSAKSGFFPKVGEFLKLPETIDIDGTSYTLN
jgi:hypothetical protein